MCAPSGEYLSLDQDCRKCFDDDPSLVCLVDPHRAVPLPGKPMAASAWSARPVDQVPRRGVPGRVLVVWGCAREVRIPRWTPSAGRRYGQRRNAPFTAPVGVHVSHADGCPRCGPMLTCEPSPGPLGRGEVGMVNVTVALQLGDRLPNPGRIRSPPGGSFHRGCLSTIQPSETFGYTHALKHYAEGFTKIFTWASRWSRSSSNPPVTISPSLI